MPPRHYARPTIQSCRSFETTALSCAKTTNTLPASWHLSSAYETYTGHFGNGFWNMESESGSYGIGFGPGGTSMSYGHVALCMSWITYSS